jgi:hypothetical protein
LEGNDSSRQGRVLWNKEGVESMRNAAVLAAVAFAALVVVMAQAGPAYAAQSAVAVSNSGAAIDTVVGTGSTVPVQLVMRGHFRGGGRAFRSSGVRSFRVGGFNRARFGHGRFFRPFVYGSVAVPYFYNSSYNNCFWDGYQWVCEEDLY